MNKKDLEKLSKNELEVKLSDNVEALLNLRIQKSLQQLGHKYGLTRERIRQQESKIYELFKGVGVDTERMKEKVSDQKDESLRKNSSFSKLNVLLF